MREQDRRAVGWGAAAFVVILLFRLAVVPYLDRMADARATLEREQGLLARERRLLAEARGYRGAFDHAGARLLATVPRLMKGGPLAETQAALSRRVDESATIAPAALTRVEALPPRPAGRGLLAIPLRVEGESDYEGFLTLLADLESGPTLFHVTDLDLRSQEAPPASGYPAAVGPGGVVPAAAPGPVTVTFRFTVTGFVLDDSGDAAQADTAGGAR
jgi:hypothetical protein